MPGLALGLGLGLTMQRGGATDALRKLFGPDDNGVLIDRLAKQAYTDTDLTTPVSADGQAVPGLKDRSGNGNNGTQATAASQATYKTGAPPYLSFDGGDSYAFPSDAGKLAGDFAVYAAVETSSVTSDIISKSDTAYSTDTGLRFWRFEITNTLQPRFACRLTNGAATPFMDGSVLSEGPHVVGVERSGTAVQFYIDGVADGDPLTVSGTLGDFTADVQMGRLWFGSSGFVNYFTGKFHQLLLLNGASLTDDNRPMVVSGLGAGLL